MELKVEIVEDHHFRLGRPLRFRHIVRLVDVKSPVTNRDIRGFGPTLDLARADAYSQILEAKDGSTQV